MVPIPMPWGPENCTLCRRGPRLYPTLCSYPSGSRGEERAHRHMGDIHGVEISHKPVAPVFHLLVIRLQDLIERRHRFGCRYAAET